MTISFTMTAGDLVTRAMQARRCLALGRTPTAAEGEYGLQRLDQLLKSLAEDKVIPWAVTDATGTILAATADLLLSPTPAEVVSVSLVVSATHHRPLYEWEIGEYDALVNKALVGQPTCYVVREEAAGVTLRFWPVPAANTGITYRYVRIPEDVETSTAIDLPQAWLEAIEVMLAVRLTAFANGNPDLPAMAAYHETRIRDLSRPATYQFEPSCA